jgi:glycosyltransferase involved in cell wall biosynthesis
MVGTFHGRDAKEYRLRPAIARWLVRQVVRQTAAFTAVSGDLGRVAENAIPGVHDVTIVRSGIAMVPHEVITQENDFTRALPDRFFLSVGRLYPLNGPPVKGHDLAIRAWGELRQRFPDLHLVIMGKADEAGSYRKLAEEHQCSQLVHIVGSHPRSDVLRAMQRSLGIVSASRHEGGGPTMTVLEAGALSKPLIASNIPAYVECLRDGVDCLIVPREDVAAIVAAVTRLVEDPPFGVALGRALAKMVTSGYSAEQVGESYAEIYRGVASRTAQRGARSVERSA